MPCLRRPRPIRRWHRLDSARPPKRGPPVAPFCGVARAVKPAGLAADAQNPSRFRILTCGFSLRLTLRNEQQRLYPWPHSSRRIRSRFCGARRPVSPRGSVARPDVGELFDEWVERSGDREAVAAHRRRRHLPSNELCDVTAAGEQSRRASASPRHVMPGSRVVVQLPECPGLCHAVAGITQGRCDPGARAAAARRTRNPATCWITRVLAAYAVARTFRGHDCLAMARALRATRPSLRHILVSGEPAADDVDRARSP